MLTKEEKKVVKGLGVRRRDSWKKFDVIAEARHAHYARKSGSFMWGLDAKGNRVQTKNLRALNIHGPDKGGFLEIVFKWSYNAKLAQMPQQKMDRLIKEGAEPVKLVRERIHILPAVRQMQHIQNGYKNSLELLDDMLSVLETQNFELAKMRKPDAGQMNTAMAEFELFRENVLSKARSPEKAIAAMGKLDMLIKKLKAVGGSNMPDFDLGTACCIFVALRERLGWGAKRNVGHSGWSRQREWALRSEGLKWVYSQLMMFIEDVHAAYLKFPPAKLGEEPMIGSPRYILEELGKTGDKYLAHFLLELEPAVDAFEKNSPTARGRFMQARDRLGTIISPQQKN